MEWLKVGGGEVFEEVGREGWGRGQEDVCEEGHGALIFFEGPKFPLRKGLDMTQLPQCVCIYIYISRLRNPPCQTLGTRECFFFTPHHMKRNANRYFQQVFSALQDVVNWNAPWYSAFNETALASKVSFLKVRKLQNERCPSFSIFVPNLHRRFLRICPMGRGGGGSEGGVLAIVDLVSKHDIAIASEVSISSKNSLAITDFLAKKTQLVTSQLLRKPPFLETPPFAIPKRPLKTH